MVSNLWAPCPKPTALVTDIIIVEKNSWQVNECCGFTQGFYHSPELDPYHVENFRLSFALEGRRAGISINAFSENAISFHVQAKLLKVNFFMQKAFLQMVPTRQVNLPFSWLYKPLSF